jgi:hypothetical protein
MAPEFKPVETSADVLRTINTFYATHRDRIHARYDVLLTLLQWKVATAALTIDEVAQVNSLLTSADAPAAKQPSDRGGREDKASETHARLFLCKATAMPFAK